MPNIKNEKSDITTESTDIKIGDYYEQHYANKFNNVDEIDKFLDR